MTVQREINVLGRAYPRIAYGTGPLTGPDRLTSPDPIQFERVLKFAVERLQLWVLTTGAAHADGQAEIAFGQLLPKLGNFGRAVSSFSTTCARRREGTSYVGVQRLKDIRLDCESSLLRLGVQQIPLLFLQRPLPSQVAPFEEQLGVMSALKAEGKIAGIGLSNVTMEHLDAAQNQGIQIDAVHNQFSVLGGDMQVVRECEKTGTPFFPWWALGPNGTATLVTDGAPKDPRIAEARTAINSIAKEYSATATQVALAFLIRKSPAMIVSVGTVDVDHLRDNCAAVGLADELTLEQFNTLDAFCQENIYLLNVGAGGVAKVEATPPTSGRSELVA